MEKLVIIGTSTTARTVYSFIKSYGLYEVMGFAVNEAYRKELSFLGLPVYSIENLEEVINKDEDCLFVAIQWNNLNADRRKVYEQLKNRGFKFANIISPRAVIHGNIKGTNCWIADEAVIDFNSVVADDVFVKVGAMIGPDTSVSAHCFIGAKAVIAGDVVIGEQSFIGLSAVIFDEVKVGRKCIVGAGTALKRNLPDFSVCKTDLNYCLIKQYEEDVIETKLQFSRNIR